MAGRSSDDPPLSAYVLVFAIIFIVACLAILLAVATVVALRWAWEVSV